MDWLLLVLCGLALFGARDALGLARFGDRKLVALHAAATLATCCILGALADQISREQAQALLRNSAFWVPALIIHVGLWFAFQRAKRESRSATWPARLFAIPAPLLVYSLGGASWFTLLNSNLPGPAAGAAVGAVYAATVLGAARVLRSRRSGAEDRRKALDLGASANLAAFLLLPLHQESSESRLSTYVVDWAETGVALGATTLLVGASFLLNRWKSA